MAAAVLAVPAKHLARPAHPPSRTFVCARRSATGRHDGGTIEAWRDGAKRPFCDACHPHLNGGECDEVHDQLVRTPARFAGGVRERAEADSRGVRSWKAPENFKIEVFVVRVGEWGGHMLV